MDATEYELRTLIGEQSARVEKIEETMGGEHDLDARFSALEERIAKLEQALQHGYTKP